MKELKRAVVALDLSNLDQNLIAYSKYISNIFGMNKIYFVHIIPNFTNPQNADLSFHNAFSVNNPVDEKVKALLKEKIDTTFNNSTAELALEIEVIEGTPSRKIIHWTEVKEADLLITGKKIKSEGSGITPRRIAQKAACDVLFVPDHTTVTPKKIVVPLDFSENSKSALEVALHFKSNNPEIQIYAVHVMRYYPRDYYFGLDENSNYRVAFKNEVKQAYQKFIEKFKLPEDLIIPKFLEDVFNKSYRRLVEYTEARDADLIIMGAKGHSMAEKLFFGSFTERFVEYSERIPILVVR